MPSAQPLESMAASPTRQTARFIELKSNMEPFEQRSHRATEPVLTCLAPTGVFANESALQEAVHSTLAMTLECMHPVTSALRGSRAPSMIFDATRISAPSW